MTTDGCDWPGRDSRVVELNGVEAVYQPHEEELMLDLVKAGAKAAELTFIHEFKAVFGARFLP